MVDGIPIARFWSTIRRRVRFLPEKFRVIAMRAIPRKALAYAENTRSGSPEFRDREGYWVPLWQVNAR